MIGVDYELFWTLNPKSLAPFVKAFELKQQHEDTLAWVQGIYIKRAIVSAMNKEAKYPNKPMMETYTGKAKVVEETPEERQQFIKDMFLIRMETINSKFKKEG